LSLNSMRAYDYLQQFDFSSFLTKEAGWGLPVTQHDFSIDDTHTRHEIARLNDVPVFEVSAVDGKIPDAHTRDALYKDVSFLYPRLLLLFINQDRTQSLWYWKRKTVRQEYKQEHFYFRGQPGDLFLGTYAVMVGDLGLADELSEIIKQAHQLFPDTDTLPEEITVYLCKQTIHKLIVEKVNEHNRMPDGRRFDSLEDVFMSLDADLCRLLLFDILPSLSILDPACGQGAFLVAALHALSNIYGAAIGMIERLDVQDLVTWLHQFRNQRAVLHCTIRKKIIVNNLFGVDINDEAIAATRTQLLNSVISSFSGGDKLDEFKSDLHFNLYAGNSLVGLLKMDRGCCDDAISDPNNRLLKQLNEQLLALRKKARGRAWNGIEEITEEDINALTPFHWGYELDQIMNERGGFDIIITDPPWGAIRPRTEPDRIFSLSVQVSEDLLVKENVHLHLDQLFIKRCYHLLRSGGQCGLMVPGGIYTDVSATQLRAFLFEKTTVTGLFCFENRYALLKNIHRGFRFVLLTFEKGKHTETIPAAFLRLNKEDLACFPEQGTVDVRVSLLYRLSPEILTIPNFQNQAEVAINEKMLKFPFLRERKDNRWSVAFTKEFDMVHQRHMLQQSQKSGLLPLYEGKMISQYSSTFSAPRYWVNEHERQASLLRDNMDKGQQLDYQYYRLSYRSISSSTNERTLIATILPPNVFVGNTITVVQGNVDARIQLFLTALFNSFVVDFYLRLRVFVQVPVSSIYQLPIPRQKLNDQIFRRIIRRAARLICTGPEFQQLWKVSMSRPWSLSEAATNFAQRAQMRAELDGLIAHLYGLTEEEFNYILRTFPLISSAVTLAAHNAYRDVERGLII
jgi:hypothetical protein